MSVLEVFETYGVNESQYSAQNKKSIDEMRSDKKAFFVCKCGKTIKTTAIDFATNATPSCGHRNGV